jgi:hypothetical protein
MLLVFLAQDLILFPRFLVSSRALPVAPVGVEEWTIDIDEGVVHAWYIRGGGRTAEAPGGTVVMMHGNGMLIEDWVVTAGWFTAMGWNVLLPEFRGYGRAAGKPSERALREDSVAFIDMLHERPEVDPRATVYYGRSIGAALAAQVARDRKPAGMILQTPPASVAAMAWRYGAPSFLVRNRFDTVSALREGARVPILLIEHDHDTIVPAAHLARVFDAAPHSQHLVLVGNHNILVDETQERLFRDEIEAFLAGVRDNAAGR